MFTILFNYLAIVFDVIYLTFIQAKALVSN